MKLFAFDSAFSEDFDPLFIPAETLEEVEQKIRKTYPHRIFNLYSFEETADMPGIHRLKFEKTLR